MDHEGPIADADALVGGQDDELGEPGRQWAEGEAPALKADPVEIPHSDLSPEALRGVVESFVLREGTDYGVRQHSLEEKVAQVMLQLERGEAQILFDPETQSVTIAAT